MRPASFGHEKTRSKRNFFYLDSLKIFAFSCAVGKTHKTVEYGEQYDHEYPSGYPKEEQPGPVEETPEPYATEPPPVEETGGEAGGENGGEDGGKKGGEEKPPKEHPEGKMMAGDTDAEKHKGCMYKEHKTYLGFYQF